MHAVGDRLHPPGPHLLLGFVVAVFKRFDDDQCSQMGALIAYYGFFSLFPLLLVFVTVLGFVLEGSPSTQESVLHSTLSQFPIIGTQLQNNVHSLKGSVPALAIGLVGATLAGLGITGAAQSALNNVWHIPRKRQLGFLAWRIRGVGLLVVFGLLTIISTVAYSLAALPNVENLDLSGATGNLAVTGNALDNMLIGNGGHNVLAGGAGALYFSQSSFWSVSVDIAGRSSGVFSSMVNMGGQIGGAVTASLTPWIAQRFGWITSFAVAAALAVVGAICWMTVHPELPLDS